MAMTINNGAHAVNGFSGEMMLIDNRMAMIKK